MARSGEKIVVLPELMRKKPAELCCKGGLSCEAASTCTACGLLSGSDASRLCNGIWCHLHRLLSMVYILLHGHTAWPEGPSDDASTPPSLLPTAPSPARLRLADNTFSREHSGFGS